MSRRPDRRLPAALKPLRHRDWRVVWASGFASYVGTWMQVVGAQWLMGSLSSSTADVALVPTAMGLPFFLLALPAGALGDIRDRRRLLIGGQAVMVLAAGGLGIVTIVHAATPAVLLALMAALGAGQAIATPSWLAVQPTLLPPEEIATGAALDGASVAVARAIGPAIGGLIVVLIGPAADFLLNALMSLLAVAILSRRAPLSRTAPASERLPAAVRTGVRYVRGAGMLRAILLRVGVFSTLAGALWALLPHIARQRLHLGAAGYGALLGSVGMGSALAAAALPRLSHRFTPRRLIAAAFLLSGGACADLAWTTDIVLAVGGLLAAGSAWVTVIALLDASAQAAVSDNLRARGLAVYEAAFQGGIATSGLIWGTVAAAGGSTLALALVAIALGTIPLLPIRRSSSSPSRPVGEG